MSESDNPAFGDHTSHFTLAEAEAELPRLRRLLTALQEAKAELTDEEAHQALAMAAPTNGGGAHGRTIGESFIELRRILLQLGDIGVILRDIDMGLIDFPSFMDDREVYLCWCLDEDRITAWHEIDEGYHQRRPLDRG